MFELNTQTTATGLSADSALSISALNSHVRLLLEGNFPSVWVVGELSNLRVPASGHAYFSLKDARAQVKCAMFRGARQQSRFEFDDGMQVVARARVSVYEPRGDYQLIVERMQPLGEGGLQQAFEQLKKRLAAAGLFDPAAKKSLPAMPRHIGLVTSPTGAALQDMLHVLARRYPMAKVWVYGTAVQGEQAAGQIVAALERAQQHALCDVLIVARGGGAIEDLWPFNEEAVAHALYACSIPVVSGVGHEIDFTIADFVADARAPTPSAAAELVSPDQQVLAAQVAYYQQQLQQQIQQRLRQAQHRLAQATAHCRHPRERIQSWAQRLDFLSQQLHNRMQQGLERRGQRLAAVAKSLDTLNPLSTLARGYSMVTLPGQLTPITDSRQLKIGDKIEARLEHGTLLCEVETIKS